MSPGERRVSAGLSHCQIDGGCSPGSKTLRVTRQGTEKPLHSTRASGQAEGHFRGSRAEGAGGNQGAGRACHTTYCIACMPFPQLKNVKEPGRRVWVTELSIESTSQCVRGSSSPSANYTARNHTNGAWGLSHGRLGQPRILGIYQVPMGKYLYHGGFHAISVTSRG